MKLVTDIVRDDLDLEIARKALSIEIEGLMSLTQVLNKSFQEVIDILFSIRGKIIVSGMGKSGHVARKIAATLASTGSAAYFVHPGEASHGDLGMIGREDALILLSNSGETAELKDMVNYSRRFSIPLISMVKKVNSTIGKASDICLVLPDIAEAALVNAPTTSTTMMMTLGDLIAICLAERRGFNKEDYKIFHPGGQIGVDLLQVRELMHGDDEIPMVNIDDKMSEVILVMTSKKFGCAVVVDSRKKIQGIITDGDLRRNINEGLLNKVALEVMTKTPFTIREDDLASKALNMMNKNSITCLFVESDNYVKGIIHIHDCLRAGIK